MSFNHFSASSSSPQMKSLLSNMCTQTRSLHGSKKGSGVFKSCVDLPLWHILAPSTW